MRQRQFGPTGREVAIVGQGTWPIPDVAALRTGIELGMTHIDTAEMYGGGRSEEVVGEAIASYDRESLFIVSKVLPANATREGVVRACELSLRRLKIDYLDCYLIHWRGEFELAETMDGLEALVDSGKIRALGVSNFDPWDLREARGLLRHAPIACNQILYNLDERTPEDHEIPWSREHACAFVAYTPLARSNDPAAEEQLRAIAAKYSVTSEAVALAFLLREPFSFVIPKANTREHVIANAAAGELTLDARDIAIIDRCYPKRERRGPLPTN